jgi:ABC-type transport system involved in multi-copper enzyme maturation permease subunit
MMRVLLWKEYREHRLIWLAMAALSGIVLLALFELLDPPGAIPRQSDKREIIAGVGGSLLIIYGFICGSIMLAGEYESGTVRFLDSLTGSRSRVWWVKTLVGTGLVLSQALCVCSLMFVLGAGIDTLPAMAWVGILTAMCLGAFAWGMLGSSLCRTVLTAAVVAFLLCFILGPLVVLLEARVSFFIIPSDGSLDDIHRVVCLLIPTVVAAVVSGMAFCRVDLDQRTSRVRSARRRDWIPWFQSWRALFWLTFLQGRWVWLALIIVSFILGLMVPFNLNSTVVWPAATMVIGVLCGIGVFAGELASGSYRFLGAQRFPAGRVWLVKSCSWLAVATVAALFSLCAFYLRLALSSDSEQHNWHEVLKATVVIRQLVPTGLYLTSWLIGGFCVGQFFTLVWRKSIVAGDVLVAGVEVTAAILIH